MVCITQYVDVLELSENNLIIEQTKDILKMSPANQIFIMGQQIRTFRQNQGLCLRELGNRCGLHSNTIWNIEQGLVVPTMFTLHRICYCLGVKKLTARFNSITLHDRL